MPPFAGWSPGGRSGKPIPASADASNGGRREKKGPALAGRRGGLFQDLEDDEADRVAGVEGDADFDATLRGAGAAVLAVGVVG